MKSTTGKVPKGASGIYFPKITTRSDYSGLFVYAMRNERNGYVKLGLSRNPVFREKTLQAEEPEITLLFSVPGNRETECDLHSINEKKRLRGEWFYLNSSELYCAYDYALSLADENYPDTILHVDMGYLTAWANCMEAVN